MASKRGDVVGKTPFPAYSVQNLCGRQFIVGGGGGTAKTGVPNAFEIYEIDAGGTNAERVVSVGTDDAVMSSATVGANNKYFVFATEEDAWRQYTVCVERKSRSDIDGRAGGEQKSKEKTDERGDMELRHRKKKEETEDAKEEDEGKMKNAKEDGESGRNEGDDMVEENTNSVETSPSWSAEVNVGELVECQYEIEKIKFYHNVLRFSKSAGALFAGCSDGKIRVWQLNKSTKDGVPVVDVEAHKGDVDDLSVEPKGTRVISLCRKTSEMVLWSYPQLKKLATLDWAPDASSKYKGRAVVYGVVEGDVSVCRLYAAYNPAVRGSKLCSYIVQRQCPSYEVSKIVSTGKEELCSLTVSSDGDFLAVGSLSGSVSVYISFSLQKMLHVPESHSTFVTALAFLAPEPRSPYDASLVSVSADSRIKLYQVKKRVMVPMVLVVLIFVACLLLAYFLLNTFNL